MIRYAVREIPHARAMERDPALRARFEGVLEQSVRFIGQNQVGDVALWRKFVDVFHRQTDYESGTWYTSWRSEYWGKMMRGASMVLAYTEDGELYRTVEASVRDMLTAQEECGRISGFPCERELQSWDLWGRKYVMLGMLYFMEICRDRELDAAILSSLCRQADYILERVGPEKLDIRACSNHWEGLNSCSILEPMVRLYRLTGEQRYLDFATYIVSTGFIQSADLVALAKEGILAPHQYPVVKAYEMMSCFEGLLQYYYVTGVEDYKRAVLHFGRKIVEHELSLIGCSGCTHELFDHTAVRQTQTDYEGVVQETCVTVTWMKLAASLLELSGDAVYADCIERSFYNAYRGAFNTHGALSIPDTTGRSVSPMPLPFDSYSPLVAGSRGRKVGGYNILSDGTYYGCCACIGAAGAGVIPQFALMRTDGGFVLNYYEKGTLFAKTPTGGDLILRVDTAYPYDGRIRLELALSRPERFSLALRVPAWCQGAVIDGGGERREVAAGYAELDRLWQSREVLELTLPMPVRRVLPPAGAVNREQFAAFMAGPIVLAADRRVTDPDGVLDAVADGEGRVSATLAPCPEIPDAEICYRLSLADGASCRLIDYASAGKTWSEDSRTAAWIRRS